MLWWKSCKFQIRFCFSHGNMLAQDIYMHLPWFNNPIFFPRGIFFNTSYNDFHKIIFIHGDIIQSLLYWIEDKDDSFSLCLLRKENTIISEWWHFSNLLSILLHYLAPSVCSYVLRQLLMKSRNRLVWFVVIFCSHHSLSNIAFWG